MTWALRSVLSSASLSLPSTSLAFALVLASTLRNRCETRCPPEKRGKCVCLMVSFRTSDFPKGSFWNNLQWHGDQTMNPISWCDFSHSCTSMSSVSSNRFPCELDNRSNNLQSKVKHLVSLGKCFPGIIMPLHVFPNDCHDGMVHLFQQTISDLRLLRHWLFVQQLQGLGVVGDLDWCFWKKQKPGR